MGVEKLSICIGGRLTDTGRFGTLGICRFGRLTLGRLLVKLLWKGQKHRKEKNDDVDAQNKAKSNEGKNSITVCMYVCMFTVQDEELIQR